MSRLFKLFIPVLVTAALACLSFLHAAERTNIAVLDIKGDGVEASATKTLSAKLRGELVNTGLFNVIERGEMNSILEEQEFQQTDCTSQECAVEIGQLLGVRHILAGSLGKIEKTFFISLRIIDVEKGAILKHVDKEVQGSLLDVLNKGIPIVVKKIAEASRGPVAIAAPPARTDAPPAKSPAPASTTPQTTNVPPAATTVTFLEMPYIQHLYMDGGTRLLLSGEKNDRMKKSLRPIPVGRHLLHYDVAPSVRYFYEFEVNPGDNFLETKFKESRLPSILRHLAWDGEKKENRKEASSKAEYGLYDKQRKLRRYKADISFSVDIRPKKEGSDTLQFMYQWKIVLDGKTVAEKKHIEVRNKNEKEKLRKKIMLYEDDAHFYAADYYIIRGSSQLDISARFISYKERFLK